MEHGQLIKAMNFILFATMKVTRRGRKLTHNIGYTQHRPTNDSNRQQMTMRLALVPLLLLPLSMRAQTPRDSIVCFTMAEAELIHDTVWSAVNHRRARIIQAAMITNLERQLADQKLITMAERQRAENAEAVVADAVAGEQQAVKDVEFWRRKANGRGWRAFFAGLIFGGAAGYGVNELKP